MVACESLFMLFCRVFSGLEPPKTKGCTRPCSGVSRSAGSHWRQPAYKLLVMKSRKAGSDVGITRTSGKEAGIRLLLLEGTILGLPLSEK